MIDLFGLKKQNSEEPPYEGDPEPAPEAPQGSHRLWAFLLVLDAVFVIVFGGAVAAKVYQHWKTPAPVPAAAATGRRRPAKEPAKPAEPSPSTTTAAAAELPKPPEPEKPSPKPDPKNSRHDGETPRPPKPSLLTNAPKPHETPKLAATAPAVKTAKALPVEFELRAADAKSVQLVGAFIVRGGHKEMAKKADGTWSVTLYLHPGQYRYFFSVDKKKMLDPENLRSSRGASLLTVP